MRFIGHLGQEAEARLFGDFLRAQDIESSVETDGGRWVVWVHDEDQVARALQLLEEFRQRPGDSKYQDSARQAQTKRDQEREESKAAARRFYDRRRLFPERLSRIGWWTAVLMAACVVVTLVTAFGRDDSFARWFAISPFLVDGGHRYSPAMQVLRGGEFWRWFTPIFVHMGPWHLLFNLLWLKDLGSLVEQRLGPWKFLGFIALTAALPNLAEFLVTGPRFGGMSGVVYGLFGYIWIRGKFDSSSGFALDATSAAIVMAWFFLCWVGVIPNVANIVHTVGLGLGMLAGYLSAVVAGRPGPF